MHTSIQEIKFRGEELTPRENEDLTARLVEWTTYRISVGNWKI